METPVSPNLHLCVREPVAIEELLVKINLLSLKHCSLLLTMNVGIGIGWTIINAETESVHPKLLTGIKVTLYVPYVAYLLDAFNVVCDLPSPERQVCVNEPEEIVVLFVKMKALPNRH